MAALGPGVDVVKFFPAEAARRARRCSTALAAPFPGVRFMPTGGIGAGDLADYFAASGGRSRSAAAGWRRPR